MGQRQWRYQLSKEQLIEFVKGTGQPRFNPYFIPKIIADIPSGVISIRYGLKGLNFPPFQPVHLPPLQLLMPLII